MNEKTGQQVATLAPPRLPWHPAIEERFGVDRAQWKALVEAVWPLAKTSDAVALALSYCKARKLDPFKRVVHIVPIWDNEKRAYVETVWPGISEHRTTAFRTGQYAGAEPCQFGGNCKQTFKDRVKAKDGWEDKEVSMVFPEWAQITVYRLIAGQRVPMPGPRVMWLETYSRRGKSVLPNDRWERAPFQMIEKCAEAAALRRAFPEELGDESTHEEIGAQERTGDDAKDITPTARPTRAAPSVEPQEPYDTGPVVDSDTGEVFTGDIANEVAASAGDPARSSEAAATPDASSSPEARPAVTAEVSQEPGGPITQVDPTPAVMTPNGKQMDWPAFSRAVQERLMEAPDLATIEAIRAVDRDNLNKMFKANRDAYQAIVNTANARKAELTGSNMA